MEVSQKLEVRLKADGQNVFTIITLTVHKHLRAKTLIISPQLVHLLSDLLQLGLRPVQTGYELVLTHQQGLLLRQQGIPLCQ